MTEADGHQVLVAAVEGFRSRIDPETGAEATDLDVTSLLNRSWSTRVSYVIGAYSDMPHLPPPNGQALLIGIEAFIPAASPRPPGHWVLDINHGLEGDAWFLLRRSSGSYELHEVMLDHTPVNSGLVAVRVARASPFPGETGVMYLGGYDANDAPAHDTAWIARGRFDFSARSP